MRGRGARKGRRGRRWRASILIGSVVGALVVADAIALWVLWPDWDELARGPIPESRFIADYRAAREGDRSLSRLQWRPIPLGTLPAHVPRAFVLAEDSRFYLHEGVDWQAVREAVLVNLDRGEIAYGGSTISQQTTKNLFFTPEQSLLRKWHELWLTWGLERNLSKHRILAIYLNVAELGPGIFGVEAAARHYYGVPASALTRHQAAELAATLPSPRRDNPATRTAAFAQRRAKVLRWMAAFDRVEKDPDAAPEDAAAVEEVAPDHARAPGPESAPPDAPRDDAADAPGDDAPDDDAPDDDAPDDDAPAAPQAEAKDSSPDGARPPPDGETPAPPRDASRAAPSTGTPREPPGDARDRPAPPAGADSAGPAGSPDRAPQGPAD